MFVFQVGARSLEVGIWGAFQNVLINLKDITDREFAESTKSEGFRLHKRAVDFTKQILEILYTDPMCKL